MPENLKRDLLKSELLQKWACFTIRERILIIRRVYSFYMSPQTLTRFYWAHGVKYRAAKTVFKQALEMRKDLDIDRSLFVDIISTIIVKNQPLIYVDETTFNSQIMQTKSWATRLEPNLHPKPILWCSVTVYGAIGNCLNEPVYYIDSKRGTTIEGYTRFIPVVAS